MGDYGQNAISSSAIWIVAIAIDDYGELQLTEFVLIAEMTRLDRCGRRCRSGSRKKLSRSSQRETQCPWLLALIQAPVPVW